MKFFTWYFCEWNGCKLTVYDAKGKTSPLIPLQRSIYATVQMIPFYRLRRPLHDSFYDAASIIILSKGQFHQHFGAKCKCPISYCFFAFGHYFTPCCFTNKYIPCSIVQINTARSYNHILYLTSYIVHHKE